MADFVFFWAVLTIIFTSADIKNIVPVIVCTAIITAVRAVNLAMTKLKFRQLGIMHTSANKVTGVLLFISMPACVLMDKIPVWLIISVGIAALLSAVEELAILITAKTYNADQKSFFIK